MSEQAEAKSIINRGPVSGLGWVRSGDILPNPRRGALKIGVYHEESGDDSECL